LKRDLFHGGRIEFEGVPVRFRTPREAVRRGIAYVTEDRKLEGFFETMTIGENIYVNLLGADKTKTEIVRKSDIIEAGRTWIEALKVRAIGANARVIELSGGNQQKVVIARSLAQVPKLVIFDEPTRGVDVGAIADLHQIINELADAGSRIRSLEEELAALRDIRAAAADRAKATQIAVANALNSAADRIEKTTQVLNRTIGGGVAIG